MRRGEAIACVIHLTPRALPKAAFASALCTSDALDSLFTSSLVRMRLLRESFLGSRSGGSDADRQFAPGVVRESVRQPMQKYGFHIFLPSRAKSPNQTMQLTATRCTIHFLDGYNP